MGAYGGVQCPNCDEVYARADLPKHMKTKKCINGELEWKHPMKKNKKFNSRGKEDVICPCKHKQCKGKVMESTTYRHMRYGIGYKFPSELKQIADRKNKHTHIVEDSDSERDL